VAAGWIAGPNPARRLADRPDIVRDLSAYRASLSELAAMGFRFEPVMQDARSTFCEEYGKPVSQRAGMYRCA
jgi:hypothetical protein